MGERSIESWGLSCSDLGWLPGGGRAFWVPHVPSSPPPPRSGPCPGSAALGHLGTHPRPLSCRAWSPSTSPPTPGRSWPHAHYCLRASDPTPQLAAPLEGHRAGVGLPPCPLPGLRSRAADTQHAASGLTPRFSSVGPHGSVLTAHRLPATPRKSTHRNEKQNPALIRHLVLKPPA